MKKVIMVLTALVFLVSLPLTALAEPVEVGREAPDFLVHSPDDAGLTPNDFIGRTAVIFYENKDLAPQTNPFKQKLGKLIAKHPNRLILINILDCSQANWLTKPFWKNKLDKKGKEYGQTLWADWEGAMISSYGFKAGDSNVVIIDSQSQIRFIQRGDVLAGFRKAEAEAVMKQCATEK